MKADKGGEFTAVSGAVLRIPPDAFADANGNPVSGEVDFKFREFRDAAEILSSGLPMTYDSAGVTQLFQSAGMFEARAEQQGKELRLRAGKAVDMDYPPARRGEDFNFYALSEDGEQWAFERAMGDELSAARYLPLELLTPKSEHKLSITFTPGAWAPETGRRIVEVRAVAVGKDNKFEGQGKYLVDTLSGKIDTLSTSAGRSIWKPIIASRAISCFDHLDWKHSFGRDLLKQANLKSINKDIEASGNFFADCLAYALNELDIAKDGAKGAETRAVCEVECARAPYFLFLQTGADKAAAELAKAVRAVGNGGEWLEPAEDDFLRAKIAERFSGDEKTAAGLSERLRKARKDSSALMTRKAALAYGVRQLRRLEALQVNIRSDPGDYTPRSDNALYDAYASAALQSVNLELRRLGAYNIDRFYKTRKRPIQATADVMLEGLYNEEIPAYATLFCYSPRAQVMQTYPVAAKRDSSGLMRGYVMAVSPDWPVVGLALEDGRIALLSRRQRDRLAWSAVRRAPKSPVKLRVKFGARRVASLEALKNAIRNGA